MNQIYDLMMRHDFYVVRTCRVKIDHNLLAKPGAEGCNFTFGHIILFQVTFQAFPTLFVYYCLDK